MKLKKFEFVSVAVILAGLLFGWLAVWHHRGDFSPDSYSYYDISRTFLGEFGKINTIRQYVVRSDYNCSFPYVFPFLIFLTNKLTGFGIYSGTALNCFIMLLTAGLFLCLSQRFTKSTLCGAVTAALLFLNSDYLEEVYAGRSIPLAILFSFGTVWMCCEFFLSEKQKLWYAPVIGILAGMNAMTRFDEISLLAYLIPVLWISACKGNRCRTVLLYGLGAGIPLLPWFVYCMNHFGTLYFTDNNGTMWNVEAHTPNYVYLPDDYHMTIWNFPEVWTEQLLKNIADTFFASAMMTKPLLRVYSAVFAAGICRKIRTAKKTDSWRSTSGKNTDMWYILTAVCLYAFAKLCMYALVGYHVSRYYTEPVFLCGFALMIILYRLFSLKASKIFMYVLPILTAWNISLSTGIFQPFLPAGTAWIQELDSALQQSAETPDDSILIAGDTKGFAFGALTGWKTYVSPDNVTPETIDYVLQNFANVQWIALHHDADEETRAVLAERFRETEYYAFYLYHLTGE